MCKRRTRRQMLNTANEWMAKKRFRATGAHIAPISKSFETFQTSLLICTIFSHTNTQQQLFESQYFPLSCFCAIFYLTFFVCLGDQCKRISMKFRFFITSSDFCVNFIVVFVCLKTKVKAFRIGSMLIVSNWVKCCFIDPIWSINLIPINLIRLFFRLFPSSFSSFRHRLNRIFSFNESLRWNLNDNVIEFLYLSFPFNSIGIDLSH